VPAEEGSWRNTGRRGSGLSAPGLGLAWPHRLDGRNGFAGREVPQEAMNEGEVSDMNGNLRRFVE